jgi:hypothetical protein
MLRGDDPDHGVPVLSVLNTDTFCRKIEVLEKAIIAQISLKGFG